MLDRYTTAVLRTSMFHVVMFGCRSQSTDVLTKGLAKLFAAIVNPATPVTTSLLTFTDATNPGWSLHPVIMLRLPCCTKNPTFVCGGCPSTRIDVRVTSSLDGCSADTFLACPPPPCSHTAELV